MSRATALGHKKGPARPRLEGRTLGCVAPDSCGLSPQLVPSQSQVRVLRGGRPRSVRVILMLMLMAWEGWQIDSRFHTRVDFIKIVTKLIFFCYFLVNIPIPKGEWSQKLLPGKGHCVVCLRLQTGVFSESPSTLGL